MWQSSIKPFVAPEEDSMIIVLKQMIQINTCEPEISPLCSMNGSSFL